MGQLDPTASFNGLLHTLRAMLADNADFMAKARYADEDSQAGAKIQIEAINELLTSTTPRA